MLIKRQFTLPLIVTLCTFAKCIIGTQSGWYFPPFESDRFQRKPRGHTQNHQYHQAQFNQQQLHQLDPKVTTTFNSPILNADGFDQQSSYSHESQSTDGNSIYSDMAKIKSYADYQSGKLIHATSRANEIEQRLATAVDLTRRKRMHFFYGLMLHSYNYIRDLRIKGQSMVKDIRKQVKVLARLTRKARYKQYKLMTKMESIEKLMVSSGDLEDKLNRSSEQFNDILNDFMVEVYKRKESKTSSRIIYPQSPASKVSSLKSSKVIIQPYPLPPPSKTVQREQVIHKTHYSPADTFRSRYTSSSVVSKTSTIKRSEIKGSPLIVQQQFQSPVAAIKSQSIKSANRPIPITPVQYRSNYPPVGKYSRCYCE